MNNNILKELKKSIYISLESGNIEGAKEHLFFGLFMGVPNLSNDLIFETKTLDLQIKLVKLGADIEPLLNHKIKNDSFHDLLTLSQEVPEYVDWTKKIHLFYEKLQSIEGEKEQNLYKERLNFFIPQFLLKNKAHEEKKLDSYEQIFFEINKKQDYSIFNRLKKIIDTIPEKNKQHIIDKATNYALENKSNSIYALYHFHDSGKNTSFNNKFANVFIENKNGFLIKNLFEKNNFNINSFTSVKTNPLNTKFKNFKVEEHFDNALLEIQKKYYVVEKNEVILQKKAEKQKEKTKVLDELRALPEESLKNPFLALAIFGKRDDKPQQQKELSKLATIISSVVPPDVTTPEKFSEEVIKQPKEVVTHLKNLEGETVLRKELQRKWDILLINEFYNDHVSMHQVVGRFMSENKINFDLLKEQNSPLNRMPMAKINDQWKSPRLFVCGYLSDAADILLSKKSIDILLNVENYAKLFSAKKIKTSEQKFTSVNPDIQAEIKEMRKTQKDYDKSTRERVLQRNSVASLRRSSWNTVK